MKEWLRSLPAVHELQNEKRFQNFIAINKIDLSVGTRNLKEILDIIRQEILSQTWKGPLPGTKEFTEEVFSLLNKKIESKHTYTLKTVINATGTILHTNLGRARLSESAIQHVIETAQNYSNLEYKLNEGQRGSRHAHIEDLLKEITGAEAAMVVNNNAAAVFLILKALAEDKEVIVSRGQLVEIGGSFRISSIMEESGANLKEVGTTNKTHLYDYENAINGQTAMIMKVHTSNFKTIGFTKTVETEELSFLSQNYDHVILYEDLGSGALFDFKQHGIGNEPIVKDVIMMGADIVSFSGDKLLGGPQAGIIAGKKSLVDRMKKHQLARVVRVDKMTLAALEGTLMQYVKGEKGQKEIPTIRDLLMTAEEIKERAELFTEKLKVGNPSFHIEIQASHSQVGGGTMPEVELPTFVVGLQHKEYSTDELSRKLRTEGTSSVVGRIQNDRYVIDLRTVSALEEKVLLQILSEI